MRAVWLFIFGIALVLVGLFINKHKNIDVKSPVAEVFGSKSEVKPQENIWYPKSKKNVNSNDVSLSAESAILVDYESGEVIYAKNPTARLPAASTIKIMTALVALENKGINSEFVISENAAKVGENSMLLKSGEILSLQNLLYGLVMVSGNDSAVAIAENVGGSEGNFVSMMNEKAADLELSDSLFINASGLDVDGARQYSSSYDLATIARYLWEKYPDFREISQTEHIYIERTDKHQDYEMYNDTNLLTTYPGVKGIKPGFTWEAGYCLVTYAENDGKKLIGVILGSSDRRGEMKELLDYGFAKFGITVLHPGLDF